MADVLIPAKNSRSNFAAIIMPTIRDPHGGGVRKSGVMSLSCSADKNRVHGPDSSSCAKTDTHFGSPVLGFGRCGRRFLRAFRACYYPLADWWMR